MSNFTLNDTEIVTLFVLTEKSIADLKKFMQSQTYKNEIEVLPHYKESFESRLKRTQEIHSRFSEHLQSLLPYSKIF